jgi:hypothetical protein
MNRGWAYLAQEKFVLALRDLERAVKLDPRLENRLQSDLEYCRREAARREY